MLLVVVLNKNNVQVLDFVGQISCKLQTICALLVKVRTVVTLCEVGSQDVWSSSLSVCVAFL